MPSIRAPAFVAPKRNGRLDGLAVDEFNLHRGKESMDAGQSPQGIVQGVGQFGQQDIVLSLGRFAHLA